MTWILSHRSVFWALASVALTTGCAGGSFGDSLQQSLEADPQLQAQFPVDGDAAQVESDPLAEEAPPPGEANPESTPSSTADPGVEGSPENQGASSSAKALPQPGDSAFIGPVPPVAWTALESDLLADEANALPPSTANASPLLDDVPADLKPYVQDWLTLGQTAGDAFAAIPFQPSRTITRGEYAQWLFAANNLFYSAEPAKRIRPGSPNSTPAFQDVPPNYPYFAAIQGLAEAGIIPSALAGNATAVMFQPDAILSRESLLLWKVPLDTRAVLPMATVEAVQTVWGFQDAAEIEPLALRAVLADRQTGDFANILRAFGFTTIFQPKRAVSQAEAAAVLWRFGHQTDGVSAQDVMRRESAPATASQRPSDRQPQP